jgi:hypothetical protein
MIGIYFLNFILGIMLLAFGNDKNPYGIVATALVIFLINAKYIISLF